MPIGLGIALTVAAAAAVTDVRSGTIPNWLTFPVLVLAPVVYGITVGPFGALMSLGSALACGLGPYVMFRRHAMGGGDVKLFAALGGVMGVDPWVGLRIQAISFVVALVFAVGSLALKGELLRRLQAMVMIVGARWRPDPCRARAEQPAPSTVRMGLPIMTATALQLAPQAMRSWGVP